MLVSRAFRILFQWSLVIGLAAAGMARADVTTKSEDKKKKPNPEQIIPEVRDMAVTFVAGKAVEIELVASAGTLKPVDFLIRQQPENGTLSAVRSHPRATNKGIVTYVHRGGGAPLTDRFSFACRVDGGSVSASAIVTLTGKIFEPKLELVDYVAADKVFLGGEATVRFSVKNNGAADFAEDIPWEDPWQGPMRIEVKSGETGRFVILFRPKAAGIYRQEKFLQSGVAGSKLPLFGECVRPLTVTPGRLVLKMGDSGAREGELHLVNGQPEPVRVQVQFSERLQGGGLIEVPGGGKARVSLALPPEDVASYQGEVKITSPQGGEVVTVMADAKPAELRAVSAAGAKLDMGSVPVGKVARGEVTIKNFGGAASIIQAQAHAPLLVRPSGEAVRLEPGGQTVFELHMTGDQPGLLARELSFIGDRAPPPIKVQMLVLPAEVRSAPVAVARRATEVEGPNDVTPPVSVDDEAVIPTPEQHVKMAQLSNYGVPVERDRINPFLEQVTDLQLLDRTSSSLTIAWKNPSVKPAGWIIEGSTMVLTKEGTGNFVKVWVPLKRWKIVDGGAGRVAARLEMLPSSVRIELRIMGVDRDNKISEPSPGFIIMTGDAWRIPAWIWWLMATAVFASAVYVLNKMRLGEWQGWFDRASRPVEDDRRANRA